MSECMSLCLYFYLSIHRIPWTASFGASRRAKRHRPRPAHPGEVGAPGHPGGGADEGGDGERGGDPRMGTCCWG